MATAMENNVVRTAYFVDGDLTLPVSRLGESMPLTK